MFAQAAQSTDGTAIVVALISTGGLLLVAVISGFVSLTRKNSRQHEEGRDRVHEVLHAVDRLDGKVDRIDGKVDRLDERSEHMREVTDRRHAEVMRHLGGHDVRLHDLETDELDRWTKVGVEPFDRPPPADPWAADE